MPNWLLMSPPSAVASVELMPGAVAKPAVVNGSRFAEAKVTEGVTLIPPGWPR